MSIEGIALGIFILLLKADINSITPSRQRHAVFHYLLSGHSSQNDVTTNTHRKRLIYMHKDKTLFTTSLSKIWENTDGCAEQYRRAYAL